MNDKRTTGDNNNPDFKLYYIPIVIKIPCYYHKNRQIDLWK